MKITRKNNNHNINNNILLINQFKVKNIFNMLLDV